MTADGTVVVDFRDLDFLRPAHLVGAAARAHAARRDGRGFRLRAPVESQTGSYAARMRLGHVLSELAAGHDVPEPGACLDRSGDLLELSMVRTHADVRHLTDLVHRKVRAVDPRTANALHETLAEVGGNVSDHAGDIGFTVAQTMPALNELRFAVADAGFGLRTTLARRGAVDDADAIRLALAGISRFDSPTRGNGLRRTVELIVGLGGQVYVASGSASMSTSPGGTVAAACDCASCAFQGTIVEATIPLSSPNLSAYRDIPR